MSATTFARLALEFATKGADQAERQARGVERAAEGAERQADRLTKTSRKATDALGGMGGAARKATDSMRGMTGVASALGGALGKIMAVIGGGLLTNALIKQADAWQDMQSRIGAAVKNMDAAPELMGRMVALAKASYSPLEQTVEVYTRNVGVLKDLGKTAEQAADFTESLNHMLVITATKGERAASVQNALSKAMAIGKLDAEGLETVLANAGRVAEALADELGTTVSGLRGFASEGKITGKVIADGLIKPLEDVRRTAGEMPATVGDAFGQVATSLHQLIGRFDQTFAITETLAGGIIALSDSLDTLAQADFAGWAQAGVHGLGGLLQIVIVLGATRIPALAGAVAVWARTTWAAHAANVAAAASTGVMNAQMAAGIIAARGLAGAMALVANAGRALVMLVGGPFAVLAGVVAGVVVQYQSAAANARDLAASTRELTTNQNDLNAAMGEYYRLQTEDALEAWRVQVGLREEMLRLQLAQAEQLLSDASFKTNFFGISLFETEDMKTAKALIEGIKHDLLEVLGTGSAIEVIEARIKAAREGQASAVATVTTEQKKALTTAQEMIRTSEQRIQQARVEVRHGKDSNLAQINALRTEREIMWAKVNTLDVSRDIKQTIMDTWWEQQQAEGQTHAWDAAANILKGTLGDAWAAVQAVSTTEPGKGWLDTAIGKAQSLFGVLSSAYERMLAFNNQNTGSMTWFKGLSGADLLPPTVPKKTGTGRKGGGGGKNAAAQELEDMAEAAKSWKDRILQAAPATERFRRELAELDKLHRAGKLSTAEHAEAVDLLSLIHI